MPKEIALSNGKGIAIVDEQDFSVLAKHSWYRQSDGYAQAAINGKNRYMHRMILCAKSGEEVDHINGNKLDNRRANIRLCNRRQNQINIGLISTNKSGFKGVSWIKRRAKWSANISLNNHSVTLGYFDDAVLAAHAYDKAARENFGQFAYLNFP